MEKSLSVFKNSCITRLWKTVAPPGQARLIFHLCEPVGYGCDFAVVDDGVAEAVSFSFFFNDINYHHV